MFSALLSSEKWFLMNVMNVVDILNYNIGFRFRFSICLYFGGSLIEVIIEIISIVNIRLSTFWSDEMMIMIYLAIAFPRRKRRTPPRCGTKLILHTIKTTKFNINIYIISV